MAFVKTHLPCSDCGSSDALSIDDAGYSKCFACDIRKNTSTSDFIVEETREATIKSLWIVGGRQSSLSLMVSYKAVLSMRR
jgi:hypothetical protein